MTGAIDSCIVFLLSCIKNLVPSCFTNHLRHTLVTVHSCEELDIFRNSYATLVTIGNKSAFQQRDTKRNDSGSISQGIYSTRAETLWTGRTDQSDTGGALEPFFAFGVESSQLDRYLSLDMGDFSAGFCPSVSPIEVYPPTSPSLSLLG